MRFLCGECPYSIFVSHPPKNRSAFLPIRQAIYARMNQIQARQTAWYLPQRHGEHGEKQKIFFLSVLRASVVLFRIVMPGQQMAGGAMT